MRQSKPALTPRTKVALHETLALRMQPGRNIMNYQADRSHSILKTAQWSKQRLCMLILARPTDSMNPKLLKTRAAYCQVHTPRQDRHRMHLLRHSHRRLMHHSRPCSCRLTLEGIHPMLCIFIRCNRLMSVWVFLRHQ